METKVSGAVVRAEDRETNESLIFIPRDNYNLKISYSGLANKSLQVFFRINLVNDQNRVGLNEKRTPGYTLLNLGASKDFRLNRDSFIVGLTIYNVFHKVSTDHMSILRAFDVGSSGRNIMFNLKYIF